MIKDRKNNISYHEMLKLGSTTIYEGTILSEGYARKENPIDNKETGFYAEVWQKGNDIVIIYKGTTLFPLNDPMNDFAMKRGRIPKQATEAIGLYDRIKRENPNCNITVTGHSLGGSLAQIVSGIRGVLAVTFNAYGTKNMFKDPGMLKTDNIVNYISELDPIALDNAENYIGDTYSVTGYNRLIFLDHFLEGMPSLSTRVKRTPEELAKVKDEFWRNTEPVKDPKRAAKNMVDIVTRAVRNKVNNIHRGREVVPNGAESVGNYAKECVGSYFVKGYTREDGTKVSGYTRTCGAKHYR